MLHNHLPKMEVPINVSKYDKNSFFDNISCSTKEKTRETKEDRQR
jgi:hypothetical protein